MAPIRIRKRIDSETLHLPELKPFLGKTVEIVVQEEVAIKEAQLETRETFFGFGPPEQLTPQQQEANMRQFRAMRADPRYERVWPFLDRVLSGEESELDVDAIIANRASSGR